MTAYFFEMHPFDIYDKLTIASTEQVVLTGQYRKNAECKAKDRTDISGFPNDLSNMKILLKYQSSDKKTYYTLYDFANRANEFLTSPPKEFKATLKAAERKRLNQ